jgi:hypothetical protein
MPDVLGLLTSDSLTTYRAENARRRVFYEYPQGRAQLMGLLSTMDSTSVGFDEFGWWEDRYTELRTQSAQANSAGPFTDTTGGSGAAGTDLTAAGWGESSGTTIRLFVDDASLFLERDQVWIKDANGTSSSIKQLYGVVDAVWSAQNSIDIRLTETVANVLNSTANNDLDVFIVGSTSSEAARSRTGNYTFPIEVKNYTQIFRNSFSFSRNALKLGLRFDKTGAYKTKSKKASLRHMELLERAAIWGRKGKQTVTNDDGESVPERTLGGLLWYLEQYEIGNTSNGGAFDYRVGGTDVSAGDWTTADEKRLINVAGNATEEQFERLIELVFRHTSDDSFEKVCYCGGKFLAALNRYFRKASIKTSKLMETGRFGQNITVWETTQGVLMFKTHPLFNMSEAFRKNGLIIDIGDLEYHPFTDSDTDLLPFRQPRDYDGRKDEWLTEYGLECRYPEGHMYITGLDDITL